MADFGKLRRGLGAPPPMEEASPNLQAPEVAPAEPVPPPPPVEEPEPAPAAVTPPAPAVPTMTAPPAVGQPRPRRDGRTMRRTNRTVAFATRVSTEWDNRIRDIAERDGLMLVEVLERALDAYEKGRKR